MARLILHIGTHKTATTTIQKSFFNNRKLLASHGVIYPDIGRFEGHHGLVTDWIKLPPNFHLPEGSMAAWQKLARTLSDGDHTVFLSSEEFSRGHPKTRMDLQAIRPFIDQFDEVKVVCVLRDQVSFLQSIYLEISKKQAPPYWGHFFQNAMKTGYASGLFMNYLELDDHLRNSFADDEIHYVDYLTACAGDGIRSYMLDLIGCPQAADSLQDKYGSGMANVSPDPLALWVASMIARPKAANTDLLELVRSHMQSELGEGRRTALYVGSEVNQLRKHVAPWNTALHERLATRQPDFALSRGTLPQDTAYRNALKSSFWLKLTKAIYNRTA